jgi:tricorn protease
MIRIRTTVAVAALAAAPLSAQSRSGTRLLAQPAIAGDQLAFVYAGDLWTSRVDGSGVRRLTSAPGDESNPVFSPDGSLLAFSANYDGNVDVYVIPVSGGAPERLTWHPGDDVVQSFSPDGKRVLFTSDRATFTPRYTQLFEVPVEGGVEERVPIPNASRAGYSPEGSRIAYNPLPRFATYPQWKHYRGGASARIWLLDRSSKAATPIPQPATGANDVDPMWVGETVYFASDRDGEFNLYGYDVGSKAVRQLTRHTGFPVLDPSADRTTGRIVYEQAGQLHLLDPRAGADRVLAITVGSDLRETRPRFVRGGQYIRNAALSPSGARAVFEFRGEIVTVPADKGDIRNLTNTTAVHERSPAWSPDGTKIAYVSDRSGEWEIVIGDQHGGGETKSYQPGGGGFASALSWAPDGKRIAYVDNSQSVYLLDLETGKSVRAGGNASYGPAELFGGWPSWSPDSKWVAFAVNTKPLVETVFLYSVEQNRAVPVTDGLSQVTSPVFDPSGKYLYLLASTDAGPLVDWFAQSSGGLRRTQGIYAIVLRKDVRNPVAKQSDEERPASPPDSTRLQAGGRLRIDLDGIESRVVALPLPAADLSALGSPAEGVVTFLRAVEDDSSLHRYSLASRRDETLLPAVGQYRLSSSGAKILYRSGPSWFITTLGPALKPGEGRIAADRIEVAIDPRAEWAEMYTDAWRINRDYFYAPSMHGADWNAVRTKYAQFLPDLATRADLNRVLQWMGSELGVGHHYITAFGDRLDPPVRVPGGLLGADYAVANGRYRFERIYGGFNWNGRLRAPLTEPGVDVRPGEYLLAVNGHDLRPPTNLYSAFVNTVDKTVELTVGPNADGTGSRTVEVVPIGNELALRNRAWIEENIRKVDSATGGRVAYVYVPNTADAGYVSFRRYFYPQAHKDAIIVDERYNGGGSAADYYIEALQRKPITWWATRQGTVDLPNPAAAIAGPKVLIVNETAGSGGDYFPWMFKKFKLGPVIGKRTWGGLVGILGFPVLMDGGAITAPDFAAWTPDEGWIVENIGVPPDIEVEQAPAQVAAGRDPQLERAIEEAMNGLAKNPPVKPKRPPYPMKMSNRQ